MYITFKNTSKSHYMLPNAVALSPSIGAVRPEAAVDSWEVTDSISIYHPGGQVLLSYSDGGVGVVQTSSPMKIVQNVQNYVQGLIGIDYIHLFRI